MKDDEILINEWLARDLKVHPGDKITLSYYIPGQEDRLRIESSDFITRDIIPISTSDKGIDLVPPFPGLSGVTQCMDWEPGIPIDLDKIRKKDEEYWDRYRELPKAYISLAAAQKIWKNPFGSLTAIHYPADKVSHV